MRIKSVVINADTDWDFSRNVWLHALDTYRHGGDTLFWTLQPEPEGGADHHDPARFWGGFPENFDRYHDALIEECARLAGELISEPDSRLAVILVLSKADFHRLGNSTGSAAKAAMSQHGETGRRALEKILSEVDRQTAHAEHSITEARARLWSAIAVRGAGDDERDGKIASQILARLGPVNCRINSALLLSHGRLQDEAPNAGEQAFLKLRLIMELMHNAGPDVGPVDAWRQFRRDPATAITIQRGVYWVRMPENRPVALASESLRRILVDWSTQIDQQRHNGQPNREVQERIASLVQQLQPLDQTAIQSRLSSMLAQRSDTTDDDEPDDLIASLDAFAASPRRRWLHQESSLAEIEQASRHFPDALKAYADDSARAERQELERLTREASQKRLDMVEFLKSVTISAGERGRREVEAPLRDLERRLDEASQRAGAARRELRALVGEQELSGRKLTAAFQNLATAERELLKPSAVSTYFMLLALFFAPAIVFNLIRLINDDQTAGAGLLSFGQHALAYSLWIICPIFGIALIFGSIAAYRLSNKRALAVDHVLRLLNEERQRIDAISAKRIAVRLARDDAAIFQLASGHLQPRETRLEVGDRRYFIGQILVDRPAAANTGIPQVDEKVQTVAEQVGSLLGRSTDDTNPVPVFLSQHGLTIDGTLTVTARYQGSASLSLANRAAWRGQLELADPGS